MIRSKTKLRRDRAAAFGWLAALAAGLMLYWWVMVNHVVVDFFDPSFAQKHEELRRRVKENPQRPLWLILGTSHVEFALQPAVLEDRLRGKNAPLIFNFGMSGAGVYRQSVNLRRILADGIQPQRVCIELMGPLMDRTWELFAGDPQLAVRARRDELDELCRHSDDPQTIRAAWKESRLNPFYKFGMRLPGQTLALRLVPIPGIGRLETHENDKWGWIKGVPKSTTPDRYIKGLHAAVHEFVGDFTKNYAISKIVDHDMRAMIDLCRQKGIQIVLLRMPEAPDFQAYYSPEANAALAKYVDDLSSEYRVPVINARSWFPDSTSFLDGHHLNAEAGKQFTVRFYDELSKL